MMNIETSRSEQHTSSCGFLRGYHCNCHYHDSWCGLRFGYQQCNCLTKEGESWNSAKPAKVETIPSAECRAGVSVKTSGTEMPVSRNSSATTPDTKTKETTEMAASLPQVNTSELERKKLAIKEKLQALLPDISLNDLEQSVKMLLWVDDKAALTLANPIGLGLVEAANEFMKDAARIRQARWDADTPDIERVYKTHRSLTAKRNARVAIFDQVINVTKRIIGYYQLQQERKAEAKRLEEERIAREQAEAQKQLEVTARLEEAASAEAAGNHDLAQFITQEALDAEAQPVIPVAIPEAPVPKVEGTSVSFKLVGTVEDPVAYVTYLLSTELRESLLKEAIASWSQSGINAQLKRGLPLQNHGVDVKKVPITRNLNR